LQVAKQNNAATKLQALLRGASARIPQAEIDERFAKADADGSGGIDVEELKIMAAAEGQELNDEEAADVMGAIDTDGDGIIDKAEFAAFLNTGAVVVVVARGNAVRATQRKEKGAATKLQALLRGNNARKETVSEKAVDSLFTAADADGSGGIDIDELQSMAAKNGEILTDEEAGEIMAGIDTDGNGIIDKKEFTAWLNRNEILVNRSGSQRVVAGSAKMDALRAKLTLADFECATEGGEEAKASAQGGATEEPVSEKAVDNLFAAADADGSGGIDIAELKSMATGNGETLSDAEADEIMAALDTHDKMSGVVDKKEFAAWLNGPEDAAAESGWMASGDKMDVLRAKLVRRGGTDDAKGETTAVETKVEVEAVVDSMLASIDKDGDGEISKEECADAGHSAEQVEAIFEKVDADGDGKLSKEEMVASGLKDAEAAAAAATATVDGESTSGVKEKAPSAPSTAPQRSTPQHTMAAAINFEFESGLPDCCTAFGEGYKVLAENATGRLVEMTLKVGQSDPPHDHPKHYMYFVEGGKLTITDYTGGEKGEEKEVDIPAGAPPIFPAGPHQVTNSGDVDVKVIFVEVTGEFGDVPEGMKSPCDTDPECYKILAEDDDWFTGEMNMGAGTKDHPHGHRDHLLYVLEGDEVTIHNLAGDMSALEGDAPPALMKVPLAAGAAMAVPAGHHWLENTGSQNCKIIFFEPKKN
jgi:Ca2+-binding EF-hand superfamily protein/mannose-6-phosphate isomerase-like protein (cupin superfamily)